MPPLRSNQAELLGYKSHPFHEVADVHRAALDKLDGTRVDFIRQGLNESFRFENPNVKGECGCGESFTV